MTYIGLPVVTSWGWTLTPCTLAPADARHFTAASRSSLTCMFNGLGAAALSYVGQGMIMGPKTGLSMMLGAIVGWAVLGPLSKSEGWAPGDIDSYRDGARGYASFATPFVVDSSASQVACGWLPWLFFRWVLWIALAIMMGDSMTSLGLLVTSLVRGRSCRRKAAYQGLDTPPRPAEPASTEDPAPLHERVPASWWGTGLALSCALCVATSSSVFGLPVYETLVAVVLALLVAVLAVRALGETDLNPVSGVGKLSQVRPAVGSGGVLRVLWHLRVVWR